MIQLIKNNANLVENYQLDCYEMAFESLFSKCFVDSLYPNVNIKGKNEVIAECVDYAKKTLRNAGGISILTNAIESTDDPYKKEFLTEFNNTCVELGNSMVVGRVIDHAVNSRADEAFGLFNKNKKSASKDVNFDDITAKYTKINKDLSEKRQALSSDSNSDDKKKFGRIMNNRPLRSSLVTEEYDEDTDEVDDIDIEEDEDIDTADVEKNDIVSNEPEMPKSLAGKDIGEVQLDSKISDKDIDNLKKAASKIDISNISKIVSDKVADVIQAEKVARFKLDEEKERLKQALINDENNSIEDENAAESAMESMLEIPLSKYDVRTHTSLFSTLQRRAVESIMSYKMDSNNVNTSDVLSEITINNTLDIFKPQQMTFYSAATKAIEMTVVNESADPETMQKIVSNATIFATIIYTFIELLNTMSLHTCTRNEIKDICTKNCNVSSVNDVACVVNKNATAAIENNKKNILKMTSIEDVNNAISDIKILKGNLVDAKEQAGVPIEQSVFDKLDELIEYGERRIATIESGFKALTESAVDIGIAKNKDADVSKLNGITAAIKYKTFDNVKFVCKEAADGKGVFAVEACLGKTPIYTSNLLVTGMESATPERYVQYLVQRSNLKSVTPRGDQPDYCAVVNGHVYEIK